MKLLLNIPFVVLMMANSLFFSVNSYAGEHENEHGDEHAEEPLKGPHNGRLLQQGNITVELAIVERGMPPEYRAWASIDGKPIPPGEWQLDVKLKRLGGKVDVFAFKPEQDFLRGQGVVEEPHSFDVNVSATHNKQQYQWTYESYEGRIALPAKLAAQSGIKTAVFAAGDITQTIKLYGKLVIDPARVRQLRARYPGIIQSVNVAIGQKVRAGEVLATIEANDSLRSYALASPINGTVIARNANNGELAESEALFTLVDDSQLLVEFPVFSQDAARIQQGQSLEVKAGENTVVSYIHTVIPVMNNTPTLTAHAMLDNSQRQWISGSWVEGNVTVAQKPVALRVDNRALQSFRDWQVVFIQVGDVYEIRPLELGISDGHFTEVLSGIKAGDRYVVENSYLLKADLEKSGASHDH